MKKLIIGLAILLISLSVSAGDVDMISLGTYILNTPQSIPGEAASLLESRLKKVIVADGFADDKSTGRFALVAQCNILEKDIAPTTPPRISQKIEISFSVVDIVENKVYGSTEMIVSGLGTNETKAFNTAFQKVSAQNQQLRSMLEECKAKIFDYYTNSCPQIMTNARTLAATGKIDEAMFILMSVPPVCSVCYNQCHELAEVLYQENIDAMGISLLEMAKTKWAASKSADSAAGVADILCMIDPRSANYSNVVKFREQVSAKLAADQKREWNFKMKQYEDNMEFKRSIVDACRSVGETFVKNFRMPQTIISKKH